MKTGIKNLFLLLLLTLPAVGQAQFNFTTNNGTITITKYTGSGGDVTIPGATNGLPVTDIGTSAFISKTTLTSITIPNSVTDIGNSAFAGCSGLTSIAIPSSVTNIGSQSAFGYCGGLKAIAVDALNPAYSSLDGVLLNKSQTILLQYPRGKPGGSYTIPNSVTSIGYDAFVACISLTKITFPIGVTNIGSFAFGSCSGLSNVILPNSITSIEPMRSTGAPA